MRAFLAALCLALTACAGAPEITHTRRVAPPADLVQDCPVPDGPVDTNGALARLVLALKQALAECNADKQALREWAQGVEQ